MSSLSFHSLSSFASSMTKNSFFRFGSTNTETVGTGKTSVDGSTSGPKDDGSSPPYIVAQYSYAAPISTQAVLSEEFESQ